MNDTIASLPENKPINKITGFKIDILDDGTYTIESRNMDYTKSMEVSCDSLDHAVQKMKMMLNGKKFSSQETKTEDNISKNNGKDFLNENEV